MREFFNTDKGRYLAIGLGVVAVLVLGWFVVGWLGDGPASRSASRVFIDSETGDVFRHKLVIGEQMPIESPSTGRHTGYEAEACYWTADGGTKPEPTWVLPRTRVDPAAGPTFCPECGRLVKELNPDPDTSSAAPPTKAEYEQRQRQREGARTQNRPPAGAAEEGAQERDNRH